MGGISGNSSTTKVVRVPAGTRPTGQSEALESNSPGNIVTLAVTGLQPGTKYTFCMTVENAAKEVAVGGPQSFTTTTTTRIGSNGNGSGQMSGIPGWLSTRRRAICMSPIPITVV